MKAKRISALFMLLLIAALLCLTLYQGLNSEKGFPKYNRFYYMKEYMAEVEAFMKENFPLAKELRFLGVQLQMLAGQRQFNGIYISDNMLIEDIEPPQEEIAAANQKAMGKFVENSTVPTYVMLLPTKLAIKQQELPENVALFSFNQKNYMEELYSNFFGKATTVDVYPILFSNYSQYIYYRTSPELTALGSYYVYSVLSQRLGNVPLPQQDFAMQHIKHNFYGETYRQSPYTQIEPDIITLYRYTKENYNAIVTHNSDYPYTYNTLYPEHLLNLSQGLDVLLGGDTGDITIRSNNRRVKSLLVFGDSSILPVLPLLTPHYSQIRFIDFSLWNSNALKDLKIEEYDQVLLAYSVDTMIHQSYPAQIEQVAALAAAQQSG